MATGNEELELFKTQINLCEYAASEGFVLERKLSSKSSATMRHPNGDKIIVARRPNGHWTYFNVHGSDSGSVICFVGARKSMSLGQIRKELRPWVGRTSNANHSSARQQVPDLVPVEPDLVKVHRRWARTRPITSVDHYLPSRGIPKSVLEDPIFADQIRIDERQNCIFPHRQDDGEVCGFEVKNAGFTGFSPGGTKSLWSSRSRSTDRALVACESAIDALSLAAIIGTNEKRFCSTAGKCRPQQVAALVAAAKKLQGRPELWLAFDNDSAGRAMASELREAVSKELGDAVDIIDKFPRAENADWNDMLRDEPKTEMPHLKRS